MTYRDEEKKEEDLEDGKTFEFLKAREVPEEIANSTKVFFSDDTAAGVFTEIMNAMKADKMKGKDYKMDKESWALTFNVDNTIECPAEEGMDAINLTQTVGFKVELFKATGHTAVVTTKEGNEETR